MKSKVYLAKEELKGVERVVCHESRNLCEHKIPGLDGGSFFQDMGGMPVRIEIFGSIFGGEAKSKFLSFIREKYLAAEPVIFASDSTEGTRVQEVLIKKLQSYESATSHNILNYEISLVEYVSPPADTTGITEVEGDISLDADNRFDSMVEDVKTEETLGNFLEEFSSASDIESFLDNIPVELLDKLTDLVGAGYEETTDVYKDLVDAITIDNEGLNVSGTLGGMTKIAAKIAVTILLKEGGAEWTELAEYFKQAI